MKIGGVQKMILQLEFKAWRPANDTFITTAGATIEVDRIEFVNNVFKGTASNGYLLVKQETMVTGYLVNHQQTVLRMFYFHRVHPNHH